MNSQMFRGARGGSIIPILIAIALLLIFGLAALMVLLKSPGGTGTGAMREAATQIHWIVQPPEFPENTPTTYTFDLERMNGASGIWDPYGNQETLVGAVTPATVTIESINGAPPSAGVPVPSDVTIAGLSGGGTMHKTPTSSTGRVDIILRGSEPADGQLTVIFLRGDGNHTVSTIQFSVTDQ